jgi:hypothetical protein
MKNIIPSREEFSALWKTKSGGAARFSLFSSIQFGNEGFSEQELYDALT